ncbi:hypothetical protein SteCoe_3841 [Stentor coeruleus]|uniref:Uncharacterized protein n=1 Tax=Stentor coeruleus TaxID=5963 RepID=A0A1R2CW75_9CILI|nr:hypothetical protein SteCoe_3841 [Stentor coeruleus]
MVTAERNSISIPQFKDFSEVLVISRDDLSLYFSLGYCLLCSFIRLKSHPESLQFFKTQLYIKIKELEPYATHLNVITQLEQYKSLVDHFDRIPRTDCILSLNSWITTADVITSLYHMGYLMLYQSANSYGFTLDPDNSNQMVKVFTHFSENLSVCLRIIWEDNHYTYSQTNTWGVYFNLYYFKEKHSYGVLIHNMEKDYDNNPDSKINIRQDPFMRIDLIKDEIKESVNQGVYDYRKHLMNFKQVTSSEVSNLLSIMAKVIKDENIYSPEVYAAFQVVNSKLPDICFIEGLKELSTINDPYCLEHHLPINMILGCRKKHCQFCVFKIIKEQFTVSNFKVACPCGETFIPPKDIDVYKKSADYQAFKKFYMKAG